MKKTVKILMLSMFFLLLLGITSCMKASSELPTEVTEPEMKEVTESEMKEVTYSKFQLTKKFNSLKFNNKDEGIIEVLEHGSNNNEDVLFEEEWSFHGYKDLKTKELWINYDYLYKESDGQLETSVKGYEANDYTYFDISYSNNKEFDDESYNLDVNNGKYKIKRFNNTENEIVKSLYNVLKNYNINIEEDISFEFAQNEFATPLFLGFHEEGYEKLKFYEEGNLFIVEFKIALEDFHEILGGYPPLIEEIEDIDSFDLEYLFIFENNQLIEFSYEFNLESVDDEFNHTIIIRYSDKEFEEIKDSEYELIEDSIDIIKSE